MSRHPLFPQGFTAAVTSRHLVMLPSTACVAAPRRVDPSGGMYRTMQQATKQPPLGPSPAAKAGA